ncbi:nitronate monooxygenase [Methylobacterium sp. 174MFSha1.1]|uniref:NAD(P)H-dependent flavin oxidoreductase n=1 Tax=Methylobacterium sp. 174MFSha1.1 TaxID=1502749 RepID=UPI0008EB5E63|nr:nitronate monooxygenase [Methylobacterium sp. 174MFSha1.1]SFV10120.1 nitronate monooxygenase [Methylobacterium sp. 174MFSha1.1]
MSARHPALVRAESFAAAYGLRRPLILAPMAGACPPALSLAVMRAGGLGACGALLMQPAAILAWAEAVREAGPFQINLWIPDPAPIRDPSREDALRAFLGRFGPAVPPEAGDAAPPDFAAQCEALIAARPRIVSSIMGLYPPEVVARLKEAGIAWWATVTTVAEALVAQEAGADAVVAQGAEAGGHRGAFEAARAESGAVGLMALLPAVVDAVSVPVVATGGIADARGAAAALLLGASAVQVGTGFLRCPEAGIPQAWADGLGRARPEDTRLTRAFSGRTGRSLDTDYVAAAARPDAPAPAPYPVQRGLTQGMREAAVREGDLSRMQAWAGQAAGLARAMPAGEVVGEIWEGAAGLLR